MKIKKSAYLNAVNTKLRDNATKKLLMFGKLDSRYSKTQLRNEEGYCSTCNNILQTAENLWNTCNGCDAVADKIANFARVPGYTDISKVKTIGAIDVTIWSLANSIIPFVAIDRGMATPIDTIYYQNLIANNAAGGIQAGDQVYGNFTPPNTYINLGPMPGDETAVSGSATADIDEHAIPGQITVVIQDPTDPSITYTGRDFTPNQLDANGYAAIYFADLPAAVCKGVKVNYATHKVSFDTLASKATVSWTCDMTKDIEGNHVLKVNASWENVQLETLPKEIILEANLINNAYMNKTYKFAGGTGDKDYTDLAFSRITDTYTEAMNVEVLTAMTGIADGALSAKLDANKVYADFSSYDLSKYAQTKDDLVNQFMLSMSSKFLGRTNVAPTVILTGTAGCALLAGTGDKWVTNPAGLKGLNGLVGYYDGTPVIRHNFFDRISARGTADFYMAFKFDDNSVASLAFGEFLPLTNTGNISNFNNPIHVANGFFSMTGCRLINDSLVQKGQIKLPTVMTI